MGIDLPQKPKKVDQGFKRYGNLDMPFFGNLEKQIVDFNVLNHNYEESKVTFLIRVAIYFQISQITIEMATLKIKICV